MALGNLLSYERLHKLSSHIDVLLFSPHPQGHPNLGVETRRRPPGIMLDQKIELRLDAQNAEDDLRGQAGVAGIEPGAAGEEQIGSISALVDKVQNIEADGTRGGEH